ncbi:MAG: ABC transporter permease [Thermoleophilia bacterium]|nr:ABC transporter permease [Thermoleophilia bacterium]
MGVAPTEPAIDLPLSPGPSRGTWATAVRRLRRDRAAMATLVVLVVIVTSTLLAPVYASRVAQTDPFRSNLSGTVEIDGSRVPVIRPNPSGLGSTPIGPTFGRHFFLGADTQGRDVAARILYGGRASLIVGVAAALLTCLIATGIGLLAGFTGGTTDAVIFRALDIVWAFPIYLLAIALSTSLLVQGLKIGPVAVDPNSLLLPILIIAVVFVPYVARPVRGEVLAVRQREYVEAAIAQGARRRRLLFKEVLPNVLPSVIVIFPLIIATCILTESALSFLSIGVQPPQASWGTIVNDGQNQLYTRPLVSIAPGLLIAVTILALNVLGDGVRDALDPRAKIRRRKRRARDS